jgi:amino-acid N-acetyltransferase
LVKASLSVQAGWFRQTAPYINTHRGKTFIILLPGEALEHSNFANILHDLTLLNSLGIRLVLVHGARQQIEQALAAAGLACHYHKGRRVTDKAALALIKQVVGELRLQLEAALSMGLPNSPMHGAAMRLVSGNFVTAKPLGVHDGIDYGYTGEVRKLDKAAIIRQLDHNAIVLLSPLGYSVTGETFNLGVEEVAVVAAIKLAADKLLCLGEQTGVLDEQQKLIRELDLSRALHLADYYQGQGIEGHIRAAYQVCQAGVGRAHLISYQTNGALLQELFTRDGIGTLFTGEVYEQIRTATIDDVGGLLQLIQPLEEQGVLVRRSRDLLEAEIDQFVVIERDGMVIACAALYPFMDQHMAEVACMVVSPAYRGADRGQRLLQYIEHKASRLGLARLFVLTTRTAHWFVEQGFIPQSIDILPEQRQQLYNLQRNSKVFVKRLN